MLRQIAGLTRLQYLANPFLATADRSSVEISTASTGFPMLATSSQCRAAAGWERLIRQIPALSLGHNWHLIRRRRATARPLAPWRTASLFVEGTSDPYNYDGIGYNGQPSTPESDILVLNLASNNWTIVPATGMNMDHRGLVKYCNNLYTIGGMDKGPTVHFSGIASSCD